MRAVLWSVPLAVAVAVLAALQAASLALFGPLATAPSVPRAMTAGWPFDVARRTGLDRFAHVRMELARAAFVRGDLGRASAELAGLPSEGDVADLRGRIALARGDDPAAIAAFGDAIDSARARHAIAAVGARDPRAAFALAAAFERDNERAGAPAAVIADSAWRAGVFAAASPASTAEQAARQRAQARAFYALAVQDDPMQETYWLSDGFEALASGDASASRDAYRRALELVPTSIDALVGLAVSDAATNECDDARGAFGRARRLAPRQHRVADPAAAGFDAASRAALQRCLDTGA
jgi:tetratricopeptide (TPR) repeat protein